MVGQLHCPGIPFAWSTALDAGADRTSSLGRSRRNLSSKIVALQIAATGCDAGAGLFIPKPPIIGPAIGSPSGTNAHPQVRLCVASRFESAPIHLLQPKLTAVLRRG